MRNYKERIDFISICLTKLDIPHEVRPAFEGWQIICLWANADVVVHDGTRGAKWGKVETLGFPWDEGGVTKLTPEEAVGRIITYWYQLNDGEV